MDFVPKKKAEEFDFGVYGSMIEMMKDTNLMPTEFIKIIESGLTDLSEIKVNDDTLGSLAKQTLKLSKVQFSDQQAAERTALETEKVILETKKTEEQIARLRPLYEELEKRHRKLLANQANNFLIQREKQHQRDWERRNRDQDTDTLKIQQEIALVQEQNEALNVQLESVNMEIDRLKKTHQEL